MSRTLQEYMRPHAQKVYLSNKHFSMCPLCRKGGVSTRKKDGSENPYVVHGSCFNPECGAKWALKLQVVSMQILDPGLRKPLPKIPRKKIKKKQPKRAENYG